MPLQPHALGAIVADVTAHPNMEVGVSLGAGEAAAGGGAARDGGVGASLGGRGEGGWVIVWSEGATSLWGSAKLSQSTLGEKGLRGWGWAEKEGAVRRNKVSDFRSSSCRSR